MAPKGPGYVGTPERESSSTDYNALTFLVRSMLDRINTTTMCRVTAVTNDGGLAPVGFVDLQPLVKLLDGAGVATERAVIYRCPYLRIQGGTNAIIIDPEVGDEGLVAFCDRDISSATKNLEPSNPGSARRFDLADAVYLFSWRGHTTPDQYVQLNAAGIRIHSPVRVKIDAPEVQIVAPIVSIEASTSTTITTPTFTVNGTTQLNGPVTGSSTITAPNVIGTVNVTFGGKSGISHVHNLASGGTTLTPA